MAENTLPRLKSAEEYTFLYNYVRALNELLARRGKFYDALNTQNPNLSNELRDPRSGGITLNSVNKVISDNAYLFGLGGLTKNHFNRIANYSLSLGKSVGNSERGFVPSVDDVDKAKENYHKITELGLQESAQKYEEANSTYKKAKKENAKKRRKLTASVLLGVPVLALGLAGLGLFGASVVGVVSAALSTTFGITSGFAVAGVLTFAVAGKWIVSGVAKLFSKVNDRIKSAFAEKRAAKKAMKEAKKARKATKAVYLSNQSAMVYDAECEKLKPYPGRSMENFYQTQAVQEEDLLNEMANVLDIAQLEKISQENALRNAKDEQPEDVLVNEEPEIEFVEKEPSTSNESDQQKNEEILADEVVEETEQKTSKRKTRKINNSSEVEPQSIELNEEEKESVEQVKELVDNSEPANVENTHNNKVSETEVGNATQVQVSENEKLDDIEEEKQEESVSLVKETKEEPSTEENSVKEHKEDNSEEVKEVETNDTPNAKEETVAEEKEVKLEVNYVDQTPEFKVLLENLYSKNVKGKKGAARVDALKKMVGNLNTAYDSVSYPEPLSKPMEEIVVDFLNTKSKQNKITAEDIRPVNIVELENEALIKMVGKETFDKINAEVRTRTELREKIAEKLIEEQYVAEDNKVLKLIEKDMVQESLDSGEFKSVKSRLDEINKKITGWCELSKQIYAEKEGKINDPQEGYYVKAGKSLQEYDLPSKAESKAIEAEQASLKLRLKEMKSEGAQRKLKSELELEAKKNADRVKEIDAYLEEINNMKTIVTKPEAKTEEIVDSNTQIESSENMKSNSLDSSGNNETKKTGKARKINKENEPAYGEKTQTATENLSRVEIYKIYSELKAKIANGETVDFDKAYEGLSKKDQMAIERLLGEDITRANALEEVKKKEEFKNKMQKTQVSEENEEENELSL